MKTIYILNPITKRIFNVINDVCPISEHEYTIKELFKGISLFNWPKCNNAVILLCDKQNNVIDFRGLSYVKEIINFVPNTKNNTFTYYLAG